MAPFASFTSSLSGGRNGNDEIGGWFERRNLPFTPAMRAKLESYGIDTVKKMKHVTIDQWKEVLCDPEDDPGTKLYRSGKAFASFREQFEGFVRGNSIFDEKLWWRYVLGALLAYFILALFVTSTLVYVINYYINECDEEVLKGIKEDFISDAVTLFLEARGYYQNRTDVDLSPDEQDILDERRGDYNLYDVVLNARSSALCRYIQHDQITIGIHNVTFGLVSAVVVQQLVSSSNGEEGLYAKFAPLLEARKEAGKYKWYHRAMAQLILQTTRVYVIVWIAVGSFCLFYGIVTYSDEGSLGMIFTTGQTWLGIAVTQTYAYFGVEKTPEEGRVDETLADSAADETLADSAADEGGGSQLPETEIRANSNSENNSISEEYEANIRSLHSVINELKGANSQLTTDNTALRSQSSSLPQSADPTVNDLMNDLVEVNTDSQQLKQDHPPML